MPPKPNPSETKILFVRAIGGEGAGATLAQKIGPLGVPAKKVQEDIAKETKEYKGLRVRVKLTVANRVATLEVQPSTACYVIKALKEPARDRKKEKNIKHHGNLTLDEIVEIARKVRHRSLAKDLSGTVREVLGTCSSMGCTIEGLSASDMCSKVKAGEVEVPVPKSHYLFLLLIPPFPCLGQINNTTPHQYSLNLFISILACVVLLVFCLAQYLVTLHVWQR